MRVLKVICVYKISSSGTNAINEMAIALKLVEVGQWLGSLIHNIRQGAPNQLIK